LVDFNKVLELDSANADAYYHRGLLYMNEDDFERAEEDFIRAQRLDADFTKVSIILGEIYYKKRQFEKAIGVLENVLSRNPELYWGHYWLALSYDVKRRYKEAIVSYEVFIREAPEEHYEHKAKMWERTERLRKWINRKKK